MYSRVMKVSTPRRFVLSLLFLWPVGAFLSCGGQPSVFAADVFPTPSPAPEKRENGSSPTPVPPTQDRPSIDPGIAIPPPAEPHPESVVTPPPIDPKMSIHPQDAPTTKQPSFPTPPPSPGATPPK